MPVLRLLPAALAFVLFGAHLYRAGFPIAAALAVAAAALAFVRARAAARLTQGLLVLAALEWIRTAFAFAAERVAAGRPVLRLAVILGTVTALTLVAAWLLSSAPVRRWRERADGA
jgi:hypothetical protein